MIRVYHLFTTSGTGLKKSKPIKKVSQNWLKLKVRLWSKLILKFLIIRYSSKYKQFQYNKKIEENLDAETVIQKSYFSENYATKYHTISQAFHFGGSLMLLTIYTNAYYIFNPKTRGNEVTKICSISEDSRYTAPAVFAHLKPLFQRFKDLQIKTLFFFTNGPAGQYRNKTAFYLIRNFAKKYSITKLIWNFWETEHGKNLIDGLGALFKVKGDTY